jgi:UDP-3-O-acyl-N-acetylglucosamine deacetylase
MRRKTISRATGPLSGLGLFSGERCSITFRPSAAATGIMFTPPGRGPIGVHVTRCVDWRPRGWPQGLPVRNTSIGTGNWSVGTVEHVMSALAGLGITDVVIGVEGPEVPILDGSAGPFVEALQGLAVEFEKAVEPVRLRREIEVVDGGGGRVRARPRAEGFSLTYELDYGPGSPVPAQSAAWTGGEAEYARDIAPARTFSLRAEAEAAGRAGLFRAFTAREMVVVGDDGQPVENAWRMADEPAKHKLLDLIGDLALLGAPVAADIVATKSGHALAREFCRKVQEAQA